MGGRGANEYERKKAWSSIDHLILSVASCCQTAGGLMSWE